MDDEPIDQMIPPPYQSQKSTDSNDVTLKEEDEGNSETVPSETVTVPSDHEGKTEEQQPIENTEIKVEIVDATANEVKQDTVNTTEESKGKLLLNLE